MGKSRHVRRDEYSSTIEEPIHDQHTYVQRSKHKKLERALKTKDIGLLLDEEDDELIEEELDATLRN